jgi:hypothetical protein
MKTICTLKSWSITILIMIVILSPALAQARYKHLPRVKIEKQIQEEPIVKQTVNTPVFLEAKKEVEPVIPTTIIEEPVAQTNFLSSTPHEKVGIVKIKVKKEELQKQDKNAYSEHAKIKRHLLDAKDVKKTHIIGYLLWFLIVLLLGIAIFVLAFVFLGIIAYSLYYIFLIFGIVGLAIALLILIFGLTGVIA